MLVFSGGTDYSPFSYEVISSGINDTATFYLDEGITNARKCVLKSVWGRFPNKETEIKLRWLWLLVFVFDIINQTGAYTAN